MADEGAKPPDAKLPPVCPVAAIPANDSDDWALSAHGSTRTPRGGGRPARLASLAVGGEVLRAQSIIAKGMEPAEALALASRLEQVARRDPGNAGAACDVAFAAWRGAGCPPLACATMLRLATRAGRVEPARRLIAVARASGLAISDPARPEPVPLRPVRPMSGGLASGSRRRSRALAPVPRPVTAAALGGRGFIRVVPRSEVLSSFVPTTVRIRRSSVDVEPGWTLLLLVPVLQAVAPKSPAANAGLCTGMRLLAVNGRPVDSPAEVAAGVARAPQSFDVAVDIPLRVWRRHADLLALESCKRLETEERRGRDCVEYCEACVRSAGTLHIVRARNAEDRARFWATMRLARCAKAEEPLQRACISYEFSLKACMIGETLTRQSRLGVQEKEGASRARIAAARKGWHADALRRCKEGAAEIVGRELAGKHRREVRAFEEREALERTGAAAGHSVALLRALTSALPQSENETRWTYAHSESMSGLLLHRMHDLSLLLPELHKIRVLALRQAEALRRLRLREWQARADVEFSRAGGMLVAEWLAHDPLRLLGDEDWDRTSLSIQCTSASKGLVHFHEQGLRRLTHLREQSTRLHWNEAVARSRVAVEEREASRQLDYAAARLDALSVLHWLGSVAPDAVQEAEHEERRRISLISKFQFEYIQLAWLSDDACSPLSPRTQFALRGTQEARAQWRRLVLDGLTSAML